MSDITGLLTSANRGDEGARGQLFAEFYPELRRLAHARMQGHRLAILLGTTALVHESYLRVLKSGRIQITDRAHFMAYSGRVMRSVIIDRLRARRARRRDAIGPLDVDAVGPASGEADYDQHEQLYINPDECIDCGACEPACPVTAIFEENAVPPQWQEYLKINADYYRQKR